tara:strand:+ start:89 stop:676 length:588 start_codon:yes stop_codon:yes gene_type:complete
MTEKNPYSVLIELMYDDNKITNDEFSSNYGPLSGSEPKYEPTKWNNKHKIKANHNCYAYALNKYAGNRGDKSQPGYFSNFKSLSGSNYTCKEFLKRLKKDSPGLYTINYNKPCKKNYTKGFLALSLGDDIDYHFYRQDSSKFWSHKPGRTNVTNKDANNNLIINPLLSSRDYGRLNYSTPCFFFCVNSKLSSLHS